jgi:hypothetical protein
MKRLLIAVPLALAGALFMVPEVYADDRRCSGRIGAQSVDGNVIVPSGATCKLIRTRIDGNVEVKSNAKLVAKGVRVDGNVQAENHKRVVVRNRKKARSRVGGSIQLEQGGGGRLLRNVVAGDIQLFSNDGRFRVRGNRIDGNLQCKSNRPRPVGGGNVVEGNKEDQCRGL